MKRSAERKLRKQWKYFIPLFIFLILSAIFYFVVTGYYSFLSNISVQSKPNLTQTNYEYEQYYVPITGYTNPIDNISFEDLKKTRVLVSKEDKDNITTLLSSRSLSRDPSASVGMTRENAGMSVAADTLQSVIQDKTQIAIVPFEDVDFRVKTLSVDGKYLWDKQVKDYPLKLKRKTSNYKEYKNRFNPLKITLLTNIGDVILGRTVAKKMSIYNDWTYPWLKMAELLKKADITFANLETPLSDRVAAPFEGMSFIAPAKSIQGLRLAGIDIVALANNHSTNFGTNTFVDTLNLLDNEGIKYVGGGRDKSEAEALGVIEKNGIKFGFLDYNSIIGAINAAEDSPGVAKFDIKPWAKSDNEADIEKIKLAIQKAKKEVDILAVELHWGVEYTPNPIDSQIKVAHAVIDSGADLIVGTHPHVVAGFENYKNTPIFYSLGNFIFDQEWSTETKQGTIAQTYFYEKKLVSSPLIPYQIEDYNQPRPATTSEKAATLSRIFGASLSPEFKP